MILEYLPIFRMKSVVFDQAVEGIRSRPYPSPRPDKNEQYLIFDMNNPMNIQNPSTANFRADRRCTEHYLPVE